MPIYTHVGDNILKFNRYLPKMVGFRSDRLVRYLPRSLPGYQFAVSGVKYTLGIDISYMCSLGAGNLLRALIPTRSQHAEYWWRQFGPRQRISLLGEVQWRFRWLPVGLGVWNLARYHLQ